MSDNEQPEKDRQPSPPPGPEKVPARGPIQSYSDLLSRGREAAKARETAALQPDRPSERLGAMREGVENTALNGKPSRETPPPVEPAVEKPTVNDSQYRPPGTKRPPTLQGPGGGLHFVPYRLPAKEPAPQKDTPKPSLETAAKREPTNAEKLVAKIEQSLKDRSPTRPPLEKPDRSPDKGRDFER